MKSLVLASMVLVACATESDRALIEGGLYSTPNDDGTFSVLKILKLAEQGVHVRVYSNKFTAHPTTLDEGTLYMVGVERRSSEGLGMGHLPLSRASFRGWRPRFIKAVNVDEDELEGYQMWLEAKAGYF